MANELEAEELDRIAGLTEEELDALPYGAIRLDHEGRVTSYNTAEAKAAMRQRSQVMGRNFFTDVAPCTDVQEFAGRFREGIARRQLHATFPYRFDFKMKPREVIVTLFYSSRTDSGWVIVRDRPVND